MCVSEVRERRGEGASSSEWRTRGGGGGGGMVADGWSKHITDQGSSSGETDAPELNAGVDV